MSRPLEIVHPNAAGIDIGSRNFYVDAGEDQIKVFPSFTADCEAIRAYLQSLGITTEVIDDISGVSGMRILRAILEGERDPGVLTEMCHTSILKKKREQVMKSLEGHYSEEHLFALGHAFQTWEYYNELIKECDVKIGEQLFDMAKDKDDVGPIAPRKEIRYNCPNIKDFHQPLLKLTEGKDPIGIAGITDYSFLQIVSEVGTDMSAWPTEKHFTSWLKVAPMRSSSGKVSKRVRMKRHNNAGLIFRNLAQGILNSRHLALGSFGRRIRARRGSPVAIKAIARKIACYYYRVMRQGTEFVERGIQDYGAHLKEKQRKYLEKMALELNLQLVPR